MPEALPNPAPNLPPAHHGHEGDGGGVGEVRTPESPVVREGPHVREAQDRFVAVWGQMGGAWGISRTMAEVHALLYITGEAKCTDDVMERLQISRGNASMSLRALLDWGIIARAAGPAVKIEGERVDRREYFRAEQDVWAMFRAIVRERIKREAEPLLASLYEIRDLTPGEAGAGKASTARSLAEKLSGGKSGMGGVLKVGVDAPDRGVAEHQRRLDDLVEFFEMLETLAQQFVSPAGQGLRLAARALTSVVPSPRAKKSRGEARAKRSPRGPKRGGNGEGGR
ncbi:MAG: GbsR/MarR family transcriptional regulator [Phycisphaerales bacterium]